MDALARYRDRQAVDRLVAVEAYRDSRLVIADAGGGALRRDGIYKYFWLAMLWRWNLSAVRRWGS